VKEFKMEKLIKMAEELLPESQDLKDLKAAWSVFEPGSAAFKQVAETKPDNLVQRFTMPQVLTIAGADHIEEAPNQGGIGWVRMFPLEEWLKTRKRVISHTTTANRIDRRIELHLNSVGEVQEGIENGKIAITLDWQQWYAAIPIPEEHRDAFSFVAPDGKRYRWKRIPAGWSHSADIAHPATKLIVEIAKLKAKQKGAEEIFSRAHIDNVLLVGDDILDVAAVVEELVLLAEALSIGINEGHDVAKLVRGATSAIEFIGHYLDLKFKKLDVSRKTKGKAKLLKDHAINVLHGKCVEWPVRFIAVAYGLGAFWHTCLRAHNQTALADFWRLNFFYSNMMREIQMERMTWESSTPIQQHIQDEIVMMLTRIEADSPISYVKPIKQQEDATHVMLTDASKAMYAVSLIELQTGKVHSIQGEFTYERKRSEDAEPYAILIGAQRFAPLLKNARLIIASDHSGFVGAFKKGMSLHSPYNIAILAIKNVKGLKVACVRHVPGKLNAMDAPSRGKRLSLQELQDSLQAIGVQVENLSITPHSSEDM
jgi:hypothetical protein